MSKFYICAQHESAMPDGSTAQSCCLKVENDQKMELSLAIDNSCGAMDVMSRISMAKFDLKKSGIGRVNEEEYYITAERFLEALADHLGFKLVPKE
jgi:hypothetical protein